MSFESTLDIHPSEEDFSINDNNSNNISTISTSSSTIDVTSSSSNQLEEENEVFEIRDFSTLSSWEKLIDRFEQLILVWFNRFSNFQFTPTESIFTKSHIIHFNGSKYLFSYFNSPTTITNTNTNNTNTNSNGNNITSSLLDFPHRSHHLTRWFGVREFFIISLYTANDNKFNQSMSTSTSSLKSSSSLSTLKNISKQSATSLSSALSVAISNLCKNIPYFILLHGDHKHYMGRLDLGNEITKFKSESLYEQLDTKYVTSSLMKLSGMIDLFCINIGKHVRITNELIIKSRYTFILQSLNSKEWLKVKDDFNFTKSERNLLFTVGTKQDPIQNFQFSCIFNSINMNEPNIDDLNIKNAHLWEIRFSQPSRDCELELCGKLKKFIENVYLPKKENKNPSSSNSYINEIIYDIFEVSSDNLFSRKSKLIQDSKPIKSCQANSLLRRFCDYVTRIKSRDDLQLLWKLFIKVLFKYWEESMGSDKNALELLEQFPSNTSFIPHTNQCVNWSTCLLEQKIDMLNISCLKECSIVVENLKRNQKKMEQENTITTTNTTTTTISNENNENRKNDEDDEWKDSGFEVLSDQSDDDEYFDVKNGQDDSSLSLFTKSGVTERVQDNDEELLLENIVESVEISGKIIKIPKTQNPPLLTEDIIEEQREIIANMTSSDQRARYQCEGLISDMQAFKFVNPGCDFSDFLLWYSPKDVLLAENDENNKNTSIINNNNNTTITTTSNSTGSNGSNTINLSNRMKVNENIWKQFWEESQPIPISKQKQIFDHKLQAEKIIHQIETMEFDIVMEQILICTLTGHYYMLKEWWIDSIMEGIDIFKDDFTNLDKLDDNLPIIRIIEKKFTKTKEELKQLSSINNAMATGIAGSISGSIGSSGILESNLLNKCVENIQDLELSISLVMSLISKMTLQGRKSFNQVHSSCPLLIEHLEQLLTHSVDCIQFNNHDFMNNTTNESNSSTSSSSSNQDNDGHDEMNNSLHESICEFLLDPFNATIMERASEFKLHCTAQRPYLVSKSTQQFMYALISRDEIRVSTALTERVPW